MGDLRPAEAAPTAMHLTVAQIARVLARSERTARGVVRTLVEAGAPSVEYRTGGRPATAVRLEAVAEHVGLSPADVLRLAA